MSKSSALFNINKRNQVSAHETEQKPEASLPEKAQESNAMTEEEVQFTIVYELTLHQQLKHAALKQGISFSELARGLLRDGIEAERNMRHGRVAHDDIDAFVSGDGSRSNQSKRKTIRTVLRLPKSLHNELRGLSIDNQEHVRDIVVRILEEGLLSG